MASSTLKDYDEVPYPLRLFAESHPDSLATIATLFGMTPPPVDRCRVLELGCARGGNLIPMAVALPGSRFVGIDLSERQIHDGREMVATLGLDNVELLHRDIMEIDSSFGQFDYIIAHGIYSWVPDLVRQRILELFQSHLSPNGVAYVSYNTYPGWSILAVVRNLVSYHVASATTAAERLQQARAFLEFLADALAPETGRFAAFIKPEIEALRKQEDYYLLHEYLAPANVPIYLHELVQCAEVCGLQYLGDSRLSNMAPSNFPDAVERRLRELAPDVIHMEQYMDFLSNRTFRASLLCHKEVQRRWAVRPESFKSLWVASGMHPVTATPNLTGPGAERFRTRDGQTVEIRDPVLKMALVCLYEAWPRPMAFADLRSVVAARLGIPSVSDPPALARMETALCELLMSCILADLIELHVYAPRFVLTISDHPIASPWARYLARVGEPIANLRHEVVPLEPFARGLLPLVDGTRNRTALRGVLEQWVEQGVLTLQVHNQPLTDAATIRARLDQVLELALRQLARAALLVG